MSVYSHYQSVRQSRLLCSIHSTGICEVFLTLIGVQKEERCSLYDFLRTRLGRDFPITVMTEIPDKADSLSQPLELAL